MKSNTAFTIMLILAISFSVQGQDGIPISEIKRSDAVDFDKEILPVLRQNCLACHNSTDAEGDVILESVAKIIESEAVVAGKPDDSSLLTLSAHLDDPVMPPEDNEVKAKNLSSDQLGLIKLWIAQGAKPSANSTANKVEFAALPPGVNPVYALDMSPNGQFLAAGRANQIFVYRVPSKQFMDRVTDPELVKSSPYKKPGIAHLDIVQSIAFAPNNQTFVSGGFRNVKIWNRKPAVKTTMNFSIDQAITSLSLGDGNDWLVAGGEKGNVYLWNVDQSKLSKTFKVSEQALESVGIQSDGKRVVVASEKRKIRLVDAASGKVIGKEILTEQDVTLLAFSQTNQHVFVAQANNSIAVYPVSAFEKKADPAGKDEKKKAEEKPESPTKPEKVLNGHSKPIVRMKSYSNGTKLLTASGDGTAKIWNMANGQQLRTFSHGSSLANVEISANETRVATCGANGTLKIFNAANSALVKEVKGDVAIDFQVASQDRDVRQKQQLIDVAKRDLDAANKEKTAEDANVKKTEEALKKADEDLKNKLAAKTKADEAFKKANDPYQKKKAEIAPLQKTQMELVPKIAAATDVQKKATAAVAASNAKLKKSTADLASARQKLDEAKKNLAKDANNADFKKAVEAATQVVAKSEQVQKTDQATKTQQDAALKAANDGLASLNTQKADVDKKIAAANAEIKKMEPNIKKVTDAQKKATDEHTASTRNQTLAKNSVDRAKARAKKAADQVPVADGKHKSAIATKATRQKSAQDFKTANAAKLSKLTSMVQLGDGILFYQDADGNSGTCDFETGERLDSVAFPESAKNKLLFAKGNKVFALSADGKSFATLQIENGWNLARTIGNIDDVKTFVDRVTALDVSADGKLLATGTGEPSRSGIIKIWNMENGQLVREIKDAHSDTILDLKFSPDGSKIASASTDRFMKTFSLADGKMIRVFEGHTHHVMSVDWNSTGRDLSSAGADKVVKVWDAETGTQKRTISGYGKEVTALCFVELTNNVITACGDKTVRLKRTDNGGELRSFSGNADFVYSVAATADGKRIAAGGEDSVVRVWNDNGQLYVEFKPPEVATSKVSSK